MLIFRHYILKQKSPHTYKQSTIAHSEVWMSFALGSSSSLFQHILLLFCSSYWYIYNPTRSCLYASHVVFYEIQKQWQKSASSQRSFASFAVQDTYYSHAIEIDRFSQCAYIQPSVAFLCCTYSLLTNLYGTLFATSRIEALP